MKDCKLTFQFKDIDIVFFVHPNRKSKKNRSLRDLISANIGNRSTFYELPWLKISEKYLESGQTIIDCGANIGNHSVYWSKICKYNVISIEPFKDNFELLEKNKEANNCDFVTVKAVLSDREKMVSCCDNKNNKGAIFYREDEHGDCISSTLDIIASDYHPIHAIKIDVEGDELNVLKGSINIINKYKPILFIEIHPYRFDPIQNKKIPYDNKTNITNLLMDMGYQEIEQEDIRCVFKYME